MLKKLKRIIKTLRTDNEKSPLITIEINKKNLLHNLNEFKSLSKNKLICPVLKSNAYGHGIDIIANILENHELPFFVIDSYFEAKKLRDYGIKTPLLIIGYVKPENINSSKLKDISYTIISIEHLKQIKNETKIHLKIDTGMHRQGISENELDRALNIIRKNKDIVLEGICSHLSDAENNNSDYTDKQIQIWNRINKKILNEFPNIKYRHLSNTWGHIHDNKIDSNMNRLGIGLYGLTYIPGLNLKPILNLKTIITSIKKINAGEMIGYNGAFIANKDMTIATIPVGYYEGIDRRLSNIGFVKIKDHAVRIIGKVCMNISIIDITELKDIKIDDEVIVISNNQDDKNSIEKIAEMCNTITYEIAVHIPEHLKRIVV